MLRSLSRIDGEDSEESSGLLLEVENSGACKLFETFTAVVVSRAVPGRLYMDLVGPPFTGDEII